MSELKSIDDETSNEIQFDRLKLYSIVVPFLAFANFFAQVMLDGGFWDDERAPISEGLAGAYFKGEHYDLWIETLVLSIALILLFEIARFAAETDTYDKFLFIPTIGFGYVLTQLIWLSTSNLILCFLSISFLTGAYWYFMRYGEVESFLGNRMVIFSIRRTIAIIIMYFTIAAMTFFMVNLIGDPVELATARIRFGKDQVQATLLRRYGLVDESGNRIPVGERFVTWIWDSMHGDFGISYETSNDVTSEIGFRLWETLKMQIVALVIAVTLSVVIGMAAAYYHKTSVDTSISAFALLGLSMPIFVSAYIVIFIFGGTGLNLLPTSRAHSLPIQLQSDYDCISCANKPSVIWDATWGHGGISTLWNFAFWDVYLEVLFVYTWDSILHLTLPVLTLAFAIMATYSRLTRSTMLEVMRQDYILAARANGISERTILSKHALRNVLLPLVTFLGLNIGGLLAGAPITETVFSWPGLGKLFVDSIPLLDIPVLMALTMIITIMILFANLLTDIVYTYLDPRLSL